MIQARYLLPLVAILIAMAAALLACGSEPTAAPTSPPAPTPETIIVTATPGPTPTPQPPVIVTATPGPTPTPQPPVVITATPAPTPAPQPPVTVIVTATPEPMPESGVASVLATYDGKLVDFGDLSEISGRQIAAGPGTPSPERTTARLTQFAAPPERMVVYDGAAVEMLFAIGQGHRVAGTHSYVTYPPETESIAKVGDAFNMDIEAIVGLEPDLVYVFYDRFNADLERAGLKVLYIKSLSHGFTDVSDQIRMWGVITGATEEANQIADDFDARVAAIQEKMEDVEPTWTVYSHGFEWWTPGRNTLVNDVFELLKLQNVADFEGYQQISPEQIVANEPDIIMADSVESVTENPVLSTLHMVEDPEHIEHHIFVMSEGNSFSVAGPRFMDAVEEFAAWVYPDVFEE